MGINIILDDIRESSDGFIIFRNGESFLDFMENNKGIKIDTVSLDHDLGDDLIDGYGVVKSLVKNELLENVSKIQFHTDNMDGFKNMYYYLINAKKHGVVNSGITIKKDLISLIDGEFLYKGYTCL